MNPPAPGETTVATQVMEPGNYAVVCFVESPDHVPHIAKGMAKALTVTESPNANTTEPTADVTMTLSDYTFTLSKPLAAGRQMIKVENAASQPHEVVLVQLAPGKTIEDVGKWAADMKGPPPGKPIGGIPAFMKGKNTYFEVNLDAGRLRDDLLRAGREGRQAALCARHGAEHQGDLGAFRWFGGVRVEGHVPTPLQR